MTHLLADGVLSPQPVPTSLLANSLFVAFVALLHIQIAAFIQGIVAIGTFSEVVSMMRGGDERHERIAHGAIRACVYVFGFGSALAIFFVVFVLGGLWGQFFVSLVRITFWPLVFEAGLFLTEIWLLYGLYANWDRLRPYRKARLGLLATLNVALWLQMFMIDIVASYMITPNQGDTSMLAQVLNPTALPLDVHRTFGNIAWAGAAMAAYAGVRRLLLMRRAGGRPAPEGLAAGTDPSTAGLRTARSVGAMSAALYADAALDRAEETVNAERARFWDFAGHHGAVWAVGATVFQPYVGYSYAKEIQLHNYPSWFTMMMGRLSTVFLVQIGLLGIIFILSALYFWRRLADSRVTVRLSQRVAFFLLVLATAVAVQPAWFALTRADVVRAGLDRPWWDGGLLNPIGSFIPYKVACLVVMMVAGLWSLAAYLRAHGREGLRFGDAGRASQWALVGLGVTVSLMMATMGVIRENARHPYLVDGEITVDNSKVLNPPGRTVPATTNPGGEVGPGNSSGAGSSTATGP